MPKVSVIVPVYGVEKYIERCARSLFSQTLEDIEFIFIDDCTPDRSIAILEEVIRDYPQRKDNIQIVKMPVNSGLPAVRKYGIDISRGDYIITCDSDDYVENTMYEDMYEYAVLNNFDLVQCDIDVVSDTKTIFTLSSSKVFLSSTELKEYILSGKISNSLCNKLVKRCVYKNDICFPSVGMDEDNALSVQLAYYSQNLGYINHSYYKAYVNTSSMSRQAGEQITLKRLEDSKLNNSLIIAFLKKKGYEDKDLPIVIAKLRVKMVLLPILSNIRSIKLWKSIFPEINRAIIIRSDIAIKQRVKYLLIETYVYALFKRIGVL